MRNMLSEVWLLTVCAVARRTSLETCDREG